MWCYISECQLQVCQIACFLTTAYNCFHWTECSMNVTFASHSSEFSSPRQLQVVLTESLSLQLARHLLCFSTRQRLYRWNSYPSQDLPSLPPRGTTLLWLCTGKILPSSWMAPWDRHLLWALQCRTVMGLLSLVRWHLVSLWQVIRDWDRDEVH